MSNNNTDTFDANDPNAPIPRVDLREPAFRKYERFIAAACNGTITVNPLDGQNTNTFVCRLRDAILGYERYHYPSKLIPLDYPLSRLKPEALNSGQVRINNRMQDEVNTRRPQSNPSPVAVISSSGDMGYIPKVSEREAWLEFITTQIDLGFETPYTFKYSTPEDRQFIIDTYKKYADQMSVRFNSAAKTAECCVHFHHSTLKNYPPEDVFQ